MYTLLGRALLALFVEPDSTTTSGGSSAGSPIRSSTLVALSRPRRLPPVVLWLLGFVWLFWLRVLFF